MIATCFIVALNKQHLTMKYIMAAYKASPVEAGITAVLRDSNPMMMTIRMRRAYLYLCLVIVRDWMYFFLDAVGKSKVFCLEE